LGGGTAAAVASGATLSVTTGPGIALTGTARLITTGDLFTIVSGGTLTTASGTTLVQVAGTGASPVLSAADLVDVHGTLTLGGTLLGVAANTTLSGAALKASGAAQPPAGSQAHTPELR